MPRRAKGPRLYLDTKRKQYVIRDGSRFIRTGARERDGVEAEKFLAEYIGHKHKPKSSSAPLIADVLSVYAEEVAPHRRTARDIGYKIGKLLEWWGDKRVSDISEKTCRRYCDERGNTGAGADLKTLRAAVRYWHESGYGPLQQVPKFWQQEEPPARERWLTRPEAARLLRASRAYNHVRRFILLSLYTGSRPGVTLALGWENVDFRTGTLVRVIGRLQARNKKAPRVRLGRRILGHLRRWHKIDGGKGPICYIEGNGKRIPVQDPHTAWAKVVKKAGLEGVTRHTLRHTRATWMAQKGVSLWEAAGFLGMSVRTLEQTYAHHDPEHQEHAANI